MRLFLIGTDRDSGRLRLVTDELFDSRKSALAFLSRSGSLEGFDEEVHLADLDAAAPVLFVSSPSTATASSPASADGAPAAVRAASGTEEPPAGDAYPAGGTPLADEPRGRDEDTPGWEVPIEESEEAGALQDEALEEIPSMPSTIAEDTGPSAGRPEADGGVIADLEPVEPAYAEGVLADASGEPAAEVTGGGGAQADAQPAAADDSSWPWGSPLQAPDEEGAALEAEPTVEPDAAPGATEDDIAAYVPDELEEPSVDADDGLLQSTGEPHGIARPVIMGEYGDESETEEPPSEAVDVDPVGAVEPEEAPLVRDVVEPMSAGEQAGPPDEPEAEAVQDLEQASSPQPAGFEPGSSDIAEYTCDDCVYVNTCPKHHEVEPSGCGSFQWRIA